MIRQEFFDDEEYTWDGKTYYVAEITPGEKSVKITRVHANNIDFNIEKPKIIKYPK